MDKTLQKQLSRGMTLVELIVVMAIFSIVVMAVMSLYIPAVQSTSIQTQVTDVQSNLRLAMNRMTQDLLTAGFLVSGDSIVFESGTSDDPNDLTIRSRVVIGGFGRVAVGSNSVSEVTLTLNNADMIGFFPEGAFVRLFNPVNMVELATYDETNVTQAQSHVYEVTDVSGSAITVEHSGVLSGVSNEEFAETIIVRVRDDQQPSLQTVRYRVVDGNLVRTLNNAADQTLARGVNSIQFSYGYSAASGRVNKVDILLQGQTTEFKGESKTRQLRSSVTLRNVF
jgi:prepilin-type N-terminal cleavage/methylation domain-containing protein